MTSINWIRDKVAVALGDARHAQWSRREAFVSFTFDDFPRSALHTGGAILEQYGVRGTYYACLSRLDQLGYFSRRDLESLLDRGHELGCHTFSHLRACEEPLGRFVADIEHNGAALERVLPGFAPLNFAYPGGQITPRAARALGRRFHTARGIQGGLAAERFDLNRLPGTAIYEHRDSAALQAAIEDNAAVRGWLVLYTHDVVSQPGPFGCTPRSFERVVRWAVDSGAQVGTVEAGYAALRAPRGAAAKPGEIVHFGDPLRRAVARR